MLVVVCVCMSWAGSPICAVLLSLRNNTAIPADLEFIFPTHREVDAEDWVEEAPLSPEQEKINDLMDAKVFDVEPRVARLGTCVCAPVCVSVRVCVLVYLCCVCVSECLIAVVYAPPAAASGLAL